MNNVYEMLCMVLCTEVTDYDIWKFLNGEFSVSHATTWAVLHDDTIIHPDRHHTSPAPNIYR
jgi:hypothetical protein